MRFKDKYDWYRTWTIGNGGMSSDGGYIRMRRGMSEEYYSDQVSGHIGEVSSGVRSFHWSRVKSIPRDKLGYMIDCRVDDIRELREELKELKGMFK